MHWEDMKWTMMLATPLPVVLMKWRTLKALEFSSFKFTTLWPTVGVNFNRSNGKAKKVSLLVNTALFDSNNYYCISVWFQNTGLSKVDGWTIQQKDLTHQLENSKLVFSAYLKMILGGLRGQSSDDWQINIYEEWSADNDGDECSEYRLVPRNY